MAVRGAAALAACHLGELDEAERHLAAGRQAVQDAAEVPPRAWWCPAAANIVALFRGDHVRAEQLAREALAVADSRCGRRSCSATSSSARLYGGQPTAAQAALPAVVRRAREVGAPTALAWACFLEGEVRLVTDPLAAVEPLREAVVGARAVGTAYVEGVAMVSLLSAAVRSGDHGVAVETFPDAVRHWQRSGMWVQQWTTLRLLAELLVELDVLEPAAVLLGAADADADAPRVSGPDVDRVRALAAAVDGVARCGGRRPPARPGGRPHPARGARPRARRRAAGRGRRRPLRTRGNPLPRTGRPGGRCPGRREGGLVSAVWWDVRTCSWRGGAPPGAPPVVLGARRRGSTAPTVPVQPTAGADRREAVVRST